MRTVSGATTRIVVVGAGLGGLACALHLAGAGREVTIVERAGQPGGRAGRLLVDGFTFDTGPTVLTMPELVAEALDAVGERMDDWLRLTTLDPAYRAWFADGSSLDIIADPPRMAAEVARVCGAGDAEGYLRFVAYAQQLWRLERADFIERNLDRPRDLLSLNLLRLLAAGAFGRLSRRIASFFDDDRLRRAFSFQALYAGLDPRRALAIYAVIAYLDAVAGVYFPHGGIHALPQALAGAAHKHGVTFRYHTTVTQVDVVGDRATAVLTADGERLPADVVVLNADLPASLNLLPTNRAVRRPRQPSPSCVVLHIGSDRAYPHIAHHNIHFGTAWADMFDQVIRRGELMSDPSLLVTNPTHTDATVAPAGYHTYYVLAPVPNLATAALAWERGLGERYADQLVAVLQQRGYPGFAEGIQTRTVVTPADWAGHGMLAGTPFSAAHTFSQTGPFRPSTLHPTLSNVVFVGCGTQPGVGVPMVLISGKLAATRVTGTMR